MGSKTGYRQNEVKSLPFVQLPLVVLADRKLSHGAKLAYCALLRRFFQKSFCNPGLSKIAALLDVDIRTTRRYIGELVTRGLLRVDARRGYANIYNRDGCIDSTYCSDDGYLTQDTIDMLLDAKVMINHPTIVLTSGK